MNDSDLGLFVCALAVCAAVFFIGYGVGFVRCKRTYWEGVFDFTEDDCE